MPSKLSGVHSVFHISMLKKCLADASQVIPVQPEELQENLIVIENAVQILDQKEQVLRNKIISLVLVQWRHHGSEEATWEGETDVFARYPHLFC